MNCWNYYWKSHVPQKKLGNHDLRFLISTVKNCTAEKHCLCLLKSHCVTFIIILLYRAFKVSTIQLWSQFHHQSSPPHPDLTIPASEPKVTQEHHLTTNLCSCSSAAYLPQWTVRTVEMLPRLWDTLPVNPPPLGWPYRETDVEAVAGMKIFCTFLTFAACSLAYLFNKGILWFDLGAVEKQVK